MEIRDYQRIWGTKKNQKNKGTRFPTYNSTSNKIYELREGAYTALSSLNAQK